jgi:hypothetical protein
MVFGFGVVVVEVVDALWSCAAGALGVCVPEVTAPLCVWLELFVAAGAGVVVELPLFFFVLAVLAGVDVLCAVAIDPATRKALTQKPAANFRYPFIAHLSRNFFSTTSSTLTPLRRVDTTSAPPPTGVAALHLL